MSRTARGSSGAAPPEAASASDPAPVPAGKVRSPVGLSLAARDRHRPLTAVALGGLGVGVLLAAFGLPPIGFADPLQYLGIVCPFCGGTRALRHIFLGDLGLAWAYNPLSVLLVAGAAGAIVRHLVGALSGHWLTVRIRWNAVTIAVLVAALGALWINQALHAELLLPG